MGIDTSMPGHDGAGLGDGLMSPLMLGDGPNVNGSFQFAQAPSVRSPTPEPEDTPMLSDTIQTHDTDPGHQPYLGRVDELDTGPLPSTPTANGLGSVNVEGEGSGEGGNMTPHGMSERPVAISSTTTPGSEDRRIAGVPRPKTAGVGSLESRFVSSESEE
jgi:hypothetical protein